MDKPRWFLPRHTVEIYAGEEVWAEWVEALREKSLIHGILVNPKCAADNFKEERHGKRALMMLSKILADKGVETLIPVNGGAVTALVGPTGIGSFQNVDTWFIMANSAAGDEVLPEIIAACTKAAGIKTGEKLFMERTGLSGLAGGKEEAGSRKECLGARLAEAAIDAVEAEAARERGIERADISPEGAKKVLGLVVFMLEDPECKPLEFEDIVPAARGIADAFLGTDSPYISWRLLAEKHLLEDDRGAVKGETWVDGDGIIHLEAEPCREKPPVIPKSYPGTSR